MAINEPYRSRFLSRITLAGVDDCWEWKAAVGSHGYGAMGVGGRGVPTACSHRLAWQHWNGEIPLGSKVLHRCDNRLCCNPTHLFLGTDKDNSDDKIAKGRANVAVGEDAGRAILTAENVEEIRSRYRPYAVTQQQLADEYGVARETIRAVVRNDSWRAVS